MIGPEDQDLRWAYGVLDANHAIHLNSSLKALWADRSRDVPLENSRASPHPDTSEAFVYVFSRPKPIDVGRFDRSVETACFPRTAATAMSTMCACEGSAGPQRAN